MTSRAPPISPEDLTPATDREAALTAENERLHRRLAAIETLPGRDDAHLRRILDSAIDFAIVATDLEGLVIRWSVGACRILGWSEAEMLGHPVDRFFTPEDVAAGRVATEMRNALETGRGDDERWHQRKGGERFWAVGEMTVLRDTQGRATGFVKVLRDRTEQRQAEERQRADAEFMRGVLASSSDCIKVLDLDGNLAFMSEGGQRVMEVSDFNAIKGCPWPAFWRGQGHEDARSAMAAAKAGGVGRFQGPADTAAGTPRFWDVQVTAIKGADGRPEKLLSISRDITATWRAETTVRESEAELRMQRGFLDTVIRRAPIGISIVEARQGGIHVVNDKACELLGEDPTDGGAGSYRPHGAVHADGRRYGIDEYPTVRALRTGLGVEREEMIHVSGGLGRPEHAAKRRLEVSSTPIRDEVGAVVAAVTTFVDIEDERRRGEHQAALLGMSERLRQMDDPAAMSYAAAESIGRALGATRAGYGSVSVDGEQFLVERDWSVQGGTSLAGRHTLGAFGPYVEDLREGRTVVVGDIRQDPRTALVQDRLESVEVRALVNLPLVEHGRTVAVMYVNQAHPRAWTVEEVSFMREMTERVRAEIERRRAERDLRVLAASLERQVEERTREQSVTWQVTPDLLSILTEDGRFESVNPAWKATLGWETRALIGVPFSGFLHPDDVVRTGVAFASLKRGDPVLRFENRYRHRDDTYRWLSWVAVPEQGKFYYSARDVTDEKEQAARLTERTAERDSFWELSRDLMLRCRFDGSFVAINPAWTDLLGWNEAELIGTSLFALIHPDDLDHTIVGARELSQGKGHARFDNRYRHKDGSFRWISWSTRSAGGVINAVGRDVTMEAAQREALAERTRERDRMWALSRDFFLIVGRDGLYKSINPTWERELGHSLDSLVDLGFTALVHPDDRAGVEAKFAGLLAGAETVQLECRLRHADGTYRNMVWVSVATSEGFYSSGRDVTEQRQTEEALRQSQKMEAVGQLTGGLAHDFNNLLTGISGSLDLLQKRVAQGRVNDLDRYLIAAQGASKRAAALTHRLLAFSRRQTLDPKPTDVRKLVLGMADLIRRTVGPAITVETVDMVGLWNALVDPSQLENALLNLCINARDAMPDGGRITVETANRWIDDRTAHERDLSPGQYLSLCVSDTGTGMPPDVVARAFDPFFTTKPLGQGTGLGLSMIYGFARQSGGQVRIYSEVGEGSMVYIYLPRHYGAEDRAEGAAARGETPRAEAGETVLVIDDEPTVRMLVGDVLSDLGYGAIEAEDGPSGLKVLESGARVDLLVTDVGLPGGMNGRQVADAARVLRPNLKVLFITGYAENAAVGNGHLDPGMAVLTKPFAMDDLAARIRALIEG